jgi:hypothetical protein
MIIILFLKISIKEWIQYNKDSLWKCSFAHLFTKVSQLFKNFSSGNQNPVTCGLYSITIEKNNRLDESEFVIGTGKFGGEQIPFKMGERIYV